MNLDTDQDLSKSIRYTKRCAAKEFVAYMTESTF